MFIIKQPIVPTENNPFINFNIIQISPLNKMLNWGDRIGVPNALYIINFQTITGDSYTFKIEDISTKVSNPSDRGTYQVNDTMSNSYSELDPFVQIVLDKTTITFQSGDDSDYSMSVPLQYVKNPTIPEPEIIKLNAESELIKNYKHASIMSVNANFKALQTSDGHALFFSHGEDKKLYVLKKLQAKERVG